MSDTARKRPRPGLLRRGSFWLALLVVGGAAAAVLWFVLQRGDELRHFTAEVQEGDIRDTVEATGAVSAVTNVQVGSQVSGTVAELDADFNSLVHRGQVVALIDSKLFVGALEQAQAGLDSAEANVVIMDASLKGAHALHVQRTNDYGRLQTLAQKNIVTPSDLDQAKANLDSAAAFEEAAVANVAQARAQVRLQKAVVSVAHTNLDYTVIRSPIDGVVVSRNVDLGQTVAASLQAPTIFTIAQDLTKMLVYAKVDESDVGRIRARQPVTFKVDAFPREQFKGSVREIRMNPTIIQNVVTYDTVIECSNPYLKLLPGMTAYVTIPVATAENAVKIPNAALRYKPPLQPDAVRALYARYGIESSEGSEHAVIWRLLADGALEPIDVATGITDHTYTQLVTGTVHPGDQVVTSSVLSKTLPPGSQGIPR